MRRYTERSFGKFRISMELEFRNYLKSFWKGKEMFITYGKKKTKKLEYRN